MVLQKGSNCIALMENEKNKLNSILILPKFKIYFSAFSQKTLLILVGLVVTYIYKHVF